MNLNENITPYQFEPCVSDTELDKSDDESVVFVEEVDEETFVENNLTNRTDVDCDTWCECGYCIKMPVNRECLCCYQVDKIKDLFREDNSGL